MKELIWTCKDGRNYRICDMETPHVENAINLIEKSGQRWRSEYYDRLKLELTVRSMGLSTKRC